MKETHRQNAAASITRLTIYIYICEKLLAESFTADWLQVFRAFLRHLKNKVYFCKAAVISFTCLSVQLSLLTVQTFSSCTHQRVQQGVCVCVHVHASECLYCAITKWKTKQTNIQMKE